MRRLVFVLFLCFGVSVPLIAQQDWTEVEGPDWTFTGLLGAGSDTVLVGGATGIARGGDGLMWVSGTGRVTVVNETGEHAAFSPIETVTLADTTFELASCQGIAALPDGNIIVTVKPNIVLKFDYQTGALLGHTENAAHAAKYGTCPSVDASGYIYVPHVYVNPIVVLDSDLNYVQELNLPGAPAVTREVLVSASGLSIWVGNGQAGAPMYNWTSTDFTNYTLTDSLFKNVNGDSLFYNQPIYANWGPDSTLWVSHDNYYGEHGAAGALENSLLNFNFATREYYEVMMPDTSVVHRGTWYFNGPRGNLISEDGNTMFVPSTNMGYVYVYVKGGVGIENDQYTEVPSEFRLYQNYPNPFNPSTVIPFNITKAGKVKITVFDINGRKVTEIFNGYKEKGTHEVTFNSNGLPAGIYIYRLQSSNIEKSRKMILLK